jgi:four helix bundle protein
LKTGFAISDLCCGKLSSGLPGTDKTIIISKLSIVVEEADESVFWLELIREAELVKPETLTDLLDEAKQIMKIMSASRKTARQ